MHVSRLLFLAIFGGLASSISAQIAASFTVSHAGLSPSAEATVAIGDTIQFIYGSGGPHPMTSGHGLNIESPVFFPTVTVTASIPEAFCTLTEPGTYFFHCGSNPANSVNWGTIEVLEPNGIAESRDPAWTFLWDPADRSISLAGEALPESYVLMNASGAVVQTWTSVNSGATIEVTELPAGMYFLSGDKGWARKIVMP